MKRKNSICVKENLWYTRLAAKAEWRGPELKNLPDQRTSAAKAASGRQALIAALKRCATQNKLCTAQKNGYSLIAEMKRCTAQNNRLILIAGLKRCATQNKLGTAQKNGYSLIAEMKRCTAQNNRLILIAGLKRCATQNNGYIPIAALKRCETQGSGYNRVLAWLVKPCPAHNFFLKYALLALLVTCSLFAQERQVDPTWLHRSTASLHQTDVSTASGNCTYEPIFGEGDSDARSLRTVTRFGELVLGPDGARTGMSAPRKECEIVASAREEEIYYVLDGNAVLKVGERAYPMRANDFTYLGPGVSHSLDNQTSTAARVLIMGFRIPQRVAMGAAPSDIKIVNLDDVKEENVSGHPDSVLYKLLVGARTANRDAIDQAHIVTSFFWMDFAPGGTNFPHHHEGAEEIYLVMDGTGDMVAGGGMDGVEGRHPAKAGDAYYFRANCTVGFYNQNKAGAKAHILAVRARIPAPDEDD